MIRHEIKRSNDPSYLLNFILITIFIILCLTVTHAPLYNICICRYNKSTHDVLYIHKYKYMEWSNNLMIHCFQPNSYY